MLDSTTPSILVVGAIVPTSIENQPGNYKSSTTNNYVEEGKTIPLADNKAFALRLGRVTNKSACLLDI
jgi:hypothetical protein